MTKLVRYKQGKIINPHKEDKSFYNSAAGRYPQKKLLCIFATGTVLAGMLTISLTASGQTSIKKEKNKQPHVVMIVLDDMGYSDIGAFGSEINTPNIDSLAYSGLRYNRFDTSSMCAPTRAALMTGRNNQTVNMEELPPKGKAAPSPGTPLGTGPANSGEVPVNAQNVAQALHTAGYATYALGKWHIAPEYKDAPQRNQMFWPRQRGFDYYYGFLSGHSSQYHPVLVQNNTELPVQNQAGYHLSVDLVDRAIAAFKQKSDNPKFIYLAFGAAHSPLQVPKSYIQAYKGKYNQGWDKLRLQRFERQKKLGVIPANTVLPPREKGDVEWDSLDEQHKRVFGRFMETYAGFITHTDEQIGRLINSLKSTKQFDNTVVIFITDNGAASEGGSNGGFRHAYMDKTSVAEMDASLDEAGGPDTDMLYQRPWAYAGSTPFRRYKLWPYLGGIRTPLIVCWPEKIQTPGAIRHQYVNVIDLAPTILDAAGTKFADEVGGVKQIPVAGKSFLPTFNSTTAKTRNVQYFELRGQRAITQGAWRAVAMHRLGTDYTTDQWQLFNTANDYSESNDVATKYPEKLQELKDLWQQEAQKYSNPTVIDPVPFFYKFNRMEDGFGVTPAKMDMVN